MIKISNTDGQTYETALVITEADNHLEAKIFIQKYLEYYMQYNRFETYENEEYGKTMDQLMSVYTFFRNGIKAGVLWIDYTICFHKWDK